MKEFLKSEKVGDEEVTAKTLMARYMREIVIYGGVTLINGEWFSFSTEAWIDCVKWVYTRVDGPPRQELGIDQQTVFNFDPTNLIMSGGNNGKEMDTAGELEEGDVYGES